jgi:hypothetical protein
MTMAQLTLPLPGSEPRGLRLVPPHRGTIDDATVAEAHELVQSMETLGAVGRWREQARRGPGGRPETFSFEAVLVGLAVCALTDQPVHLTRVCEVLFCQLSPYWRERLGLPDPPTEHDQRGWQARYRRVRHRFHCLIDLMDPSPTPKNRRLDDAEFQAETARREAELTEDQRGERYDRLEFFINRIIEASIQMAPRDVRRNWKGSAGIDATLVRSHSRGPKRPKGGGTRKGKPITTTHSADPDCGYYSREKDLRDDDEAQSTGASHGRKRDKLAWGYEASLVVSGPDDLDGYPNFPNLVVGMTVLHKPAVDIGSNGARVLANIGGRGHPAGFLAGDRAYSGAKAEKFQLRALALGYRPVYDYRGDQLGVATQYQGFLQIEGEWYCPSMPQSLIDATKDYRARSIDEHTYAQRLEERWKYRARRKGRPDHEGHVRLSCPAAQIWLLARCELKPRSLQTIRTQGKLHITVKADVKADPPPSCSKESVMVPPEAGAKFHQELLYGSAEWHSRYNTLRNTNEGMNGYLKDPAHEALDDPARRRVHGVAAQSILVAFLVMAANVRKIRTFLAERQMQLVPAGPVRRPRRRKTRSLDEWRPKSQGIQPGSDPDPPLVA